ncbi:cobyrinate a,c-diamide synthase [Nostoc sp. TCL26-01]|uniref:cobyrinate a,c-diamide synthase n=1 Tax=Nostoc sp. TCL26-01 TaxID=2576904 RepID=UPI0015B7E434|nr:cobyrinate a,c-diamide synthase [Nostoc sp. TCL26-01]QLE57563.1 cobyrinate a,c-diamide synthase [Nostoc sp. TCL26-01]
MAVVIAGERSGVGKTTVTLALLASLCRRNNSGAMANHPIVKSFKVGPDYIDPMFHTYVTGSACRNLDPVLTSEAYVQQCFVTHQQNSEYALVEGVMGLFDGIGQLTTDFASTAHIARLLDLPVVLVIDCSRLSGSVAAIAHGYCSFDPRIKIAGLVLNRVGSDRHLCLLKNSLQALQLPILGVIRRQDNITIPDRHLGLIPTAELPELDAVIHRLADLGDTCFDWQSLLPLLRTEDKGTRGQINSKFKIRLGKLGGTETDTAYFPQNSKWDKGSQHRAGVSPVEVTGVTRGQGENTCIDSFPPSPPLPTPPSLKIAVACDRAFNFYYQDNLDLLQHLGAEIVFWSPLTDEELPPGIQGMYFGGGFPEVFAQELAANIHARDAVKQAILNGIPTIAECGGLMYLCEQIVDFSGKSWPMVGVLPTSAAMGGGLTLGYRRAVALQDSLLVNAGTSIYGHEFHRSRLISTPTEPLFETYRYDYPENMGCEGWGLAKNIHASYIHLHWGESVEIPQRFLEQCRHINYVETLQCNVSTVHI